MHQQRMMDSCVVLGSSVDVLVRLPRRCLARIRHATRVRMLRDTLVQRFIRKHCNEHPLHAYKPPVLSFASEQHAHAVHTSSFRSFYIEATLGVQQYAPGRPMEMERSVCRARTTCSQAHTQRVHWTPGVMESIPCGRRILGSL